MERVRRLDRSSLSRAQRLDNGMIRAPARLTRVGVFTYLQRDGKTVRELRLPEEVFSAEALSSFELVPLTNEHPAEGDGSVTAENAKRLSVGAVANVKRDAEDRNFVAAELMVFDSATASAVESGKREVSCGYFCDREPAEPGSTYTDPVTGETLPYDFVQRNIRGNHVAIVGRGRAGAEARILLDAHDAIEVESTSLRVEETQNPGITPTQEEHTMNKITIDGVTYEVSPQVMEAIGKERKINADMIDAMKNEQTKTRAELDKATARADATEAELKKTAEALKSATAPETIRAAVQERVSLESIAAKFEIKCDGLSNMEIRRAVIAKLDGSIKLDGKSDDYTIGMFDHVTRAGSAVNKLGDSQPVTADAVKSATDRRAAHRAEFFKPTAAK